MQITNQYNQRIFWRAFRSDDSFHVVGLKEGSVERGNQEQWVDSSFPEIKVEVKSGDNPLSSKVLAPAGPKFKMTDNLLVTPAGDLRIG